ncbi:AAA family ATPase [Galbibacter sp. PAP.153]|uniref:AAA family ATPase n=1 Tax=Galbibacter sp. PAP.153 TaxID=3104623 RepID=UPI003009061C
MVLEIKLSNFFSISDEIILDLRAGNINTEKSRSLNDNVFEFDDIEVLKTVALYGANASGKSNIIKAIRFCIAMVYDSHKHNENSIFNFRPFKFKGYSNKPSNFFIRFVYEDIEYKYSFSLTRNEIISESLYHYPNGRKAKVFVRDEKAGNSKRDKYSFGTSVIKRPFDVVESTSNKTLFISRASQMDREIPKKIFHFFHGMFIRRHSSYSISNIDSLIKTYKYYLLKGLHMADSDIVDFKHRLIKEKGKKIRANVDTQEAFIEDDELESIEIKTYHRYSPNIAFDFVTEESNGTKKLFFMLLTILDILRNNKTLLVDEIEDSLHPKIVDYIIKLFNTGEKAQLIFTTYNTNLLDLSKFRKDQIWFVNKTTDGNSDLYSLYDYSDFRDTMDLEKAYLQGRFDSIPIVDDSIKNLKSIIVE